MESLEGDRQRSDWFVKRKVTREGEKDEVKMEVESRNGELELDVVIPRVGEQGAAEVLIELELQVEIAAVSQRCRRR